MDEGCERKRGVRVDPKVFGLNHWKDGNPFTEVRKRGRSAFMKDDREMTSAR